MCLITIAFYAVPTNIAMFIKKEQIGNLSSAGLEIAVFTFGGFAAGILLSAIKKNFKHFTITVGIGIMCLGYSLLLYSYSIYLIGISVALVGFSFGIIYPMIFLHTIKISKKFNFNCIVNSK